MTSDNLGKGSSEIRETRKQRRIPRLTVSGEKPATSGEVRGALSLYFTEDLKSKFIDISMKVVIRRMRPFRFFDNLRGKIFNPERKLMEFICPGIED